MIELLDYQDSVTFYEVEGGNYSNSKTVASSASVDCTFIQNTQLSRSRYQDSIESDAFCYPDPKDAFITAKFNRLEGMYVLAPLFGAGDNQSWYKVIDVTINRDHLLSNEIDNIELRLKKTDGIPGVS